MIKLGCLIIDDEPNAGQLLQDYIAKVPYLTLKGTCFDALEALEFLGHSPADLIFLDINMPGLSGMELVNILPKEQKVIFTTAYSEYALESYQYNVVDYLLKPITFARFMMAVAKAADNLSAAPQPVEEYLFVKSDKQMIRVNFRDILYFEALKEYICVHTKNQKIITYKRMKELADRLPAQFTRIHNSYIVNGDHIAKVEGNFVLIDNKSLPIGISYKDSFAAFIQLRAL
ncbi:MAG TPA: response regulator transcription factor [Puia sp.]|nr:response regulator transcription factor [Puia sp.]